jgi:diphthine-ammonia ligase
MQCVANGHQIVVLANLHPPPVSEELDSFMFQSVGHSAIEAIAQCMQLPLVRRQIQGRPLHTDAQYTTAAVDSDGDSMDEVEDLYQLLADVRERYPEVEAVASGAILSNYQRVRVENACSRLGLASLAYLWQQDQRQLLRSMIDSGLHAIVIKVAGMGLGSRHLGCSLGELYDELCVLNDRYGLHVAGEGGEYETLTIDCPLYRRQRIQLDQVEQIVHSNDAFAPVIYLRVLHWSLIDKPVGNAVSDTAQWRLISSSNSMDIVDERFICDKHKVKPPSVQQKAQPVVSAIGSIRQSTDCIVLSGVIGQGQTAAEQIDNALQIAERSLQGGRLTLSNVVQCRLYLRSMDDFMECNSIYQRHFGLNHPPTRVCLATFVLRTPEAKCQLDLVAFKGTTGSGYRLHVQSISYWAPANIGPYSQAIVTRQTQRDKLSLSKVYIAGQIALVPETMQLASSGGMQRQIVCSANHCASIAFAVLNSDQSATDRRLSDVFGVDCLGDSVNNSSACILFTRKRTSSPLILCIGYADRQSILPAMNSYMSCTLGKAWLAVPSLLISVKALPRLAVCEWETQVFHPESRVMNDDNDSDNDYDSNCSHNDVFAVHRGLWIREILCIVTYIPTQEHLFQTVGVSNGLF